MTVRGSKPPAALLSELRSIFTREAGDERPAPAIDRAEERALAMIDAAGGGDQVQMITALAFIADLVCLPTAERAWSRSELDRCLTQCAVVLGMPPDVARQAVALHALRDRGLAGMPPRLAIDRLLQIAASLTTARALSVWLSNGSRQPRYLAHTGPAEPGRSAAAEARRCLTGGPPNTRSAVHSVKIHRWQLPAGALVLTTPRDGEASALVVAAEAAAAIGAILEQDLLLHQSTTDEVSSAAAERRIARFVLDLHDGAMQAISALADEVRHFKRQLEQALNGNEHRGSFVEQLEEIEARLGSIDDDLRTLSRPLETGKVMRRPLREALREEVAALRGFGIATTLVGRGSFRALTDSQRIATIRLVQEALANVRRHSGARTAAVTVVANGGSVRVEIVDDGCGFDVDAAMADAARRGRLGMAGMRERVRMLGGRLEIESRPNGGPTRIVAVLPEWRPLVPPPGKRSSKKERVAVRK